MADRQQLIRVAMTGSDSTGLAEFQNGHVDGGPLIPAYTETERDAITTATEGMVIYNTDDDRLEVRTSSAWLQLDVGDVTGVTTGATSGISGGATSGAVDIAIDATRLTDGTSIDVDEDNDLVMLYDNSATAMKKVNPVQLFTNEALVWMGL
mgnify:FL=1|tara:strand:- start:13737 stop:14192 length:456 start_codon:yes stop_codon:yes gene_type:complete